MGVTLEEGHWQPLKRMVFESRLESHGMRSMASTILNEHDWDPELIEVALRRQGRSAKRLQPGGIHRTQATDNGLVE
jgi:hypothetical protein